MFWYRRTVTEGGFNVLPVIVGGVIGLSIIVAFMAILPVIIIVGEVLLGSVALGGLLIVGTATRAAIRQINGRSNARLERISVQPVSASQPESIEPVYVITEMRESSEQKQSVPW